jgi:hypothetical protein
LLSVEKKLPNFWILIFAFILFTIQLCMIKCNYDVINLSIFVIYDMQYVATPYGSKTNWISMFANHKWASCALNALIFMFLRVCF